VADYILIVEDDASFAELVREHLTVAGYAIKVTTTARQALACIEQQTPSLVLLDIHLAGAIDGWDLLVQLKRERASWDIPVIITSVTENKKLGVSLGVLDYLVKPFGMDRLLGAVRGVVGVGIGQSVLIVEDDVAFRSAMAESLKKVGFHVDEDGNGAEVAGHLNQHLPSLLILDFQMPTMNGFQVLTRLREKKETLTLPVLVVTGVSLTQDEQKFIKQQMAALLPKNRYTPVVLVEKSSRCWFRWAAREVS
jgi:DNA-binding response OmpR family regulator